MKVVHQASEVPLALGLAHAAIGFFDGVHLGHQRVLAQMLGQCREQGGQPLVVTFDQHPATVVAPERTPKLIYPLAKKLALLADAQVAATLLYHFDRTFSEQAAEDFVRGLASAIPGLRSISVGANFTFGHQRRGNVQLLRALGPSLKLEVHAVAACLQAQAPVSSTRIRESIRSGDFTGASQMLGRPYALVGRVTRGDQLGRQMGFPTANLDLTGLILPPNGVYAVSALVEGRSYPGVLNIGFRPTLRKRHPELHIEAHLLEFQGDLYETTLEVIPRHRLREERQFQSLAEPKAQIGRDVAAARELLKPRAA